MYKAKFLFLIFCTILHLNSSDSVFNQKGLTGIKKLAIISDMDIDTCKVIQQQEAKCECVKSYNGFQTRSYIPYLQLFYCRFNPILGYVLLVTWLLILFYLLGDTASSYFCHSLEGLSITMKLSPTVAGVTLLSLGNGAPDVFDGIISFMGDGNTADIGLNSILGGAFFVSSVVVGVVCLSISCSATQSKIISYPKNFTWNIIFLLLSLCCLLMIIIFGKINLWASLGFLSLYLFYVAFIFVSESYASSRDENLIESPFLDKVPILPTNMKSPDGSSSSSSDLQVPLLEFVADELVNDQKGKKISIYGWFKKVIFILGLPLDLPRKLTIPIICEEKWSKPFGVVSTLLAPILLATTWNFQNSKQNLLVYIIGLSIGIASSILLFCITDSSTPPRKYKFLWLSESFLMSVIWIYLCAQELVALLVSIGLILGISNSIMGLTILAWGNSLGDLFSNVTMSRYGGPGGTQMAISGCYAGPIFNVVFGLGLSLSFATWAVYPSSFQIVSDPSIYETFGFFMLGLVWALLVVTKSQVALDKLLGCGLLVIYVCFLVLKMAQTLGLLDYSFYH